MTETMTYIKENIYHIPRAGKPAVEVRLHRPQGEGTHPAILNMHGGGWVGGDAVLMESFAKLLSEKLNAYVFNVNYQKHPVKPFPYAAEEVCDVVRFIRDNAESFSVDRKKIAVGGFSAGAQIAASSAVLLADAGIPVAAQYLGYPCTDMRWAKEHYPELTDIMFPDGDFARREASPVLAEAASLKNTAPAVFVLCEHDVLRDQGRAYAQKLIDAGVTVLTREFPAALHGFVEVNRPDYPANDSRRSPEQEALCHAAEQYLIRSLSLLFASGDDNSAGV